MERAEARRDRNRALGGRINPLTRLFVALDPPGEVRDAVDRAIAPWRRAIPEARWQDRAQWHVTVRFLGEMPTAQIDRIAALVGSVGSQISPFETSLDGLGAFPRRGAARVLWVGLDDRVGRLAGLALAIDAALLELAGPARRSPHPHLTVARLDPGRKLPDGFLASAVEPASFPVDGIRLYRSRLGQGSPRYDVIASAQLEGR